MSLRMRAGAVVLAMGALIAFAATPNATAAATPTDYDLAFRWAPVHYQDTDSSDYDAEYLTAVDYDGDWTANNNWEHQDDNASRLVGTAYYSVVETATHWFLVYGFFHPRDWVDRPDPFDLAHHENDMEGVLLTVRKDGSTFGRLEAAVTVFHTDFRSYVPAGSPYVTGRETVDGTLRTQTVDGVARPTTYQEAKGHGLTAWNGAEFGGNDGVVYYPAATGEVPSGGNDRSVNYRLVDIFAADGLWARRADRATYAGLGTFDGNDGKDDAANAPWGWDDNNDGSDLPRGQFATDPAALVAAYFNGEGTFALAYTRNGYR